MFGSWRRQPAVAAERLGSVLADVRHARVDGSRLITDVLTGGYRSLSRGHGIEIAEVREYVEGDDPRHVDWNVTARIGRPFVKRYVEERERTLVFVLDQGSALASSFGAWSLRQVAARFCALFGLLAIGNHDRVGLVAGAGSVARFAPPRRGVAHVYTILRDVVAAAAGPPAGPRPDLAALLAHVAARLRRRSVVFVLSDFLAPLPPRELLVAGRHHDLVAVRLTAQELLAPPPVLLRVQDPAGGPVRLVDFAAARVRERYLERVQTQRAATAAALRHAMVDRIDLVVPALADMAAITRPVLGWFRRRELREQRR